MLLTLIAGKKPADAFSIYVVRRVIDDLGNFVIDDLGNRVVAS
jgi:hypothetical protein